MNALRVATALIATSASLNACDKGCYDLKNGICACDQTPQFSTETVIPSAEKPRRNGIPSWQSGEIKADMPNSLTDQDAKSDADRINADSDGKKAAGIK